VTFNLKDTTYSASFLQKEREGRAKKNRRNHQEATSCQKLLLNKGTSARDLSAARRG
jgi:hypothetical protein